MHVSGLASCYQHLVRWHDRRFQQGTSQWLLAVGRLVFYHHEALEGWQYLLNISTERLLQKSEGNLSTKQIFGWILREIFGFLWPKENNRRKIATQKSTAQFKPEFGSSLESVFEGPFPQRFHSAPQGSPEKDGAEERDKGQGTPKSCSGQS